MFSTIFRSYSGGAEGILINRWLLDGIERWTKEIYEHAPRVPRMLVANPLSQAFKWQLSRLRRRARRTAYPRPTGPATSKSRPLQLAPRPLQPWTPHRQAPLPVTIKSHLRSFSMANGMNAVVMHGRSYSLASGAGGGGSEATASRGPSPFRLFPWSQNCSRSNCKIS
ncbi:hypothetical protein HPG69_004929 [Diceros bicornis minor]|uniref:Uncharacterized protein n=1 Tax=Diceros bicornis minor TaxID=77932 RepID=A0A7J7E4Y8_DICBM|nr:hypothetical protein HPG69_004929 [Diceros bicornis minor]